MATGRVLSKGLRWNGVNLIMAYDQIDEQGNVMHSFTVKATKAQSRYLGYVFECEIDEKSIRMAKKPEPLCRWANKEDITHWTAFQREALTKATQVKLTTALSSSLSNRLAEERAMYKKAYERGDGSTCRAIENLVLDALKGLL